MLIGDYMLESFVEGDNGAHLSIVTITTLSTMSTSSTSSSSKY